MHITKSKLKKIIQEELEKLLYEQAPTTAEIEKVVPSAKGRFGSTQPMKRAADAKAKKIKNIEAADKAFTERPSGFKKGSIGYGQRPVPSAAAESAFEKAAKRARLSKDLEAFDDVPRRRAPRRQKKSPEELRRIDRIFDDAER